MGFQVEQVYEQNVRNIAQQMMEEEPHDEAIGHDAWHGAAELLKNLGFGEWAYVALLGFAVIGAFVVFRNKVKNFLKGWLK